MTVSLVKRYGPYFAENTLLMAISPDGVLVYKSRYGSTQQYAEWIKKELRIPMIDPERLDDQILSACDFVVVGTPVYLGEMLIKEWLRQNEQRLRSKLLFLFVVCTYFSDREKQQTMIKDNLPDSILNTCQLHFLPGKLSFQNLSAEDARLLGLEMSPDTRPAEKDTAPGCPPAEERILPLVESVRSLTTAKLRYQH